MDAGDQLWRAEWKVAQSSFMTCACLAILLTRRKTRCPRGYNSAIFSLVKILFLGSTLPHPHHQLQMVDPLLRLLDWLVTLPI
jgi:hypothetical protein